MGGSRRLGCRQSNWNYLICVLLNFSSYLVMEDFFFFVLCFVLLPLMACYNIDTILAPSDIFKSFIMIFPVHVFFTFFFDLDTVFFRSLLYNKFDLGINFKICV